jgi:probable F420-dependent oxidoreductase
LLHALPGLGQSWPDASIGAATDHVWSDAGVLIDTMIGEGASGDDLLQLSAEVDAAEALGLDGVWSSEVKHDPFLCCLLAAQRSKSLRIGTAIAVAFARSPMTVATSAYDLQTLSEGRFDLGLGSQIKPHIERRFNMPWSAPAARMAEYIQALHAIWDSWETGDRLDFRGEFYQHTLMTPMFSPGPSKFGRPRVLVAAVGDRMTRVAGEVADGLIVHSFTTARYLREKTLPQLEETLTARGRARSAFEVYCPVFIATGETDEELSESTLALRKRIAFYGSTPAYSPVLELHGWGEVHVELNRLSKLGQWDEMASLVDDEVLGAFAVTGPPETIGGQLADRFGGVLDRISWFAQTPLGANVQSRIVADLRAALLVQI